MSCAARRRLGCRSIHTSLRNDERVATAGTGAASIEPGKSNRQPLETGVYRPCTRAMFPAARAHFGGETMIKTTAVLLVISVSSLAFGLCPINQPLPPAVAQGEQFFAQLCNLGWINGGSALPCPVPSPPLD